MTYTSLSSTNGVHLHSILCKYNATHTCLCILSRIPSLTQHSPYTLQVHIRANAHTLTALTHHIHSFT